MLGGSPSLSMRSRINSLLLRSWFFHLSKCGWAAEPVTPAVLTFQVDRRVGDGALLQPVSFRAFNILFVLLDSVCNGNPSSVLGKKAKGKEVF